MKKKYFGTDGIRGKVGTHPITADVVLHLGWAVGRVLARGGQGKVLIGKDTRISGYMFESALQAGLSSAGVDIRLLGPMPTPGIAYLTRTLHAKAGIVISASHNPYYDNGIKFFSSAGTKLAGEVELAIEHELESPMETVSSSHLGKVERVVDASGRYIEFCKSTGPASVDLSGIKVVIDCAHGATYHVAPDVFKEMGASVITIGVSPNGLNINDGYGSTSPETLRRKVLESEADVGIALDGDGDRVIMIDHKGEIVDGDELLYIIARSRQRDNTLSGSAVVGTLMSNIGLEKALITLGISLIRAQVGDRYVLEMLQDNKCILGGESSGHIICLDRTTTGDGIISALQILVEMATTGKSLYDLKEAINKYPQCLINVHIDQKINPYEDKVIMSAVRDVENQLRGEGRVLLRSSGTESVIRIMVEGPSESQVSLLAQQLAQTVTNSMNQL
ncbi:phosphoglucosamine mutase [Candidatus Nitrosacidococcus sp. I8]|uniref:phosphoglucosamine mutase n=1 Tax=Candidatus Nitrosacidococcus sp. I8 TaxID=2942908 RepID=UPI002227AC24|nr:phosphoglucosamine mutase [Candidatus Nitrosacidococcus sp. I8]CAH9016406.1 Phosphoglucosamine mutase [Candidatus Nitrosacidococcus sp. I8]